ncbi:MAG TPA: hypothetical protein VJV79_12915 [Polyangiaceae bacterium]|nr:hypothetical protein [Polyangiaceae bacterium]
MAACSSSSDGGPTGASGWAGSAGVTGSGAGSGGTDQGNAGNGGRSSGGGGSGGNGGQSGSTSPSKAGQVVFSAYASGQSQLIASFSDLPSGAEQHCVETALDGCSISLCDDVAPVIPAIRPSAGTIILTSPDVSGSAVLEPQTDGSYGPPRASFGSTFLGQEILSFRASGGAVPAFQNELTMPLALLRSAPYVDNSDGRTRLQIPSTRDLSLTWTRGVPDVWLIMDASTARVDGMPGTASLYCAFPSESGTGTVRASLLKQLEQEALLRNLTVLIKRTLVGDYAVTLATTFDVYDESKKFAVTSTLQLHDP